jgi:hypothetical protein
MFRSDAANRDASEPPAPGCSSRRQGRWAKGWDGVKVRFSVVVSWTSVSVVVVMSVEARERSSASLLGSERRAWSSASDCIGQDVSLAN